MNQIPIITLKNEMVELTPLLENDFEKLFEVASDPMIWEQHPNPDRYKKEPFTNYFNGAILSKGAFLISDAKTNEVIGSSRFYDFFPEEKTIKIGYTFFSRKYWGKLFNQQTKKLMLDYAFSYVEKVQFEVGAQNIRSQIAMERLGAKKVGEREVAYFGELPKLNFIYEMNKIS